MQIFLALAVSLVSGATFYESPHNERAAPFYKIPVQRDFSSPTQYYKPPASSPYYRPEPTFAASAYKPEFAFKPETSFYNPSVGGYKSQYSASQYSGGQYSAPQYSSGQYSAPQYNGGGYGHGASSYQTVRSGSGTHEYNKYF